MSFAGRLSSFGFPPLLSACLLFFAHLCLVSCVPWMFIFWFFLYYYAPPRASSPLRPRRGFFTRMSFFSGVFSAPFLFLSPLCFLGGSLFCTMAIMFICSQTPFPVCGCRRRCRFNGLLVLIALPSRFSPSLLSPRLACTVFRLVFAGLLALFSFERLLTTVFLSLHLPRSLLCFVISVFSPPPAFVVTVLAVFPARISGYRLSAAPAVWAMLCSFPPRDALRCSSRSDLPT